MNAVLPGSVTAHPPLRRVLAALAPARALIVGGAVRNGLLGEAVEDIDIATDALPERVIALAGAAGLRTVPTGIAHGTVTVIADGEGFEVTTFRRDVATDGRRAVVAFSDRIEDDAARRDFTMNALYADTEGRVIDPVGGLPDLAARRLRFVGDPDRRIAEDYLRILRFFRFHAHHGRPRPSSTPPPIPRRWPPVRGAWPGWRSCRASAWGPRCASCWMPPIPPRRWR